MAINAALMESINILLVCLSREQTSVPENVSRDDELLVVQVISELSQVVHIRQLLPKLVTEGNKKKFHCDRRRKVGSFFV